MANSRDIAEYFEKQHQHVTQAIENLTSENSLVKSMVFQGKYMNNRGRTYKEYFLTRDGFSLLVMGFTGVKALGWKLKYIDAFNKMENKLCSSLIKPDSYMIEDLIERTKRWIEEAEYKKLLEAANKILQPKAELADHLFNSTDTIDMLEMSKLASKKGIKIGRNTLFEFLRSNNILMQNNLPYQKYITWFEVVEQVFDAGGKTKINFKTLVTVLGQDGIFKLLIKNYSL